MASIYDIIAATPDGGTAVLPAGEFEGPVVIGRPMKIQGSSTTIWSRHGAVIDVEVPGVTLEGLRVEITEGEITENAITTKFPAVLRDVEVLGTVSGFGAEDGLSEIPRTLALGELSAQEDNTFLMTVDIPAAAEILCTQGGVKFVPDRLPAGHSEVRLTVEAPGTPGLIYTEVLVNSGVRRRIYLSGRFTAGALAVRDRVVFTAQDVVRSAPAAVVPQSLDVPSLGVVPGGSTGSVPGLTLRENSGGERRGITDVVEEVGEAPLPDIPMLCLKKGQRVPIAQYLSGKVDIYLTGQRLGNADIDPYVFLLNEQEKSDGDGSLVFFGNEVSRDGAVRYHKDDGHVTVNLAKLSPEVKRVTVAYSVYSGDSVKNFSQVREPRLSLYSQEKERVRFDIDGLTNEITIIAAELYIYHGEWRISAVGSGYRDGLVKLCNRYGIEVCS